MKFQSPLILLASFVSAALSATITDVIGDVNHISAQITHLNDAVRGGFPFPYSALPVHFDVVDLGAIIDKATSDVLSAPKPFSPADGLAILNVIKAFEPNLVSILALLVAKKTLFESLPGTAGLPTVQDLINLRASTSKFEAQLIASAPSNMASAIKEIETKIDAVFADAIAAFH